MIRPQSSTETPAETSVARVQVSSTTATWAPNGYVYALEGPRLGREARLQALRQPGGVGRDRRQLGPRERALGRADDADATVLEHGHVLDRGLELVPPTGAPARARSLRSRTPRPLPPGASATVRASPCRTAPVSECTRTLERHAEHRRRELRERGPVPLPLRRRPDAHGHRSLNVDVGGPELLVPEARHLDVQLTPTPSATRSPQARRPPGPRSSSYPASRSASSSARS